MEKLEPTSETSGTEIVTLEARRIDTNALLDVTAWSSDSRDGVLIHSYAVGTDAAIAMDPPVVFLSASIELGHSVRTETNAGAFTSTLLSKEECPNDFQPETERRSAWTCLYVELEGPGLGIEGEYSIAPRWGMSRFRRTHDPDDWVLLDATWAPE